MAQTPPESSHEARGEDSDPGRPRYEDINTPARLDAFLDALNAKPPAAKPAPPRPAPSPARRPAPDPRPWESFKDPKYVAGWLAERTGKQAQAPASPPPGPEPRGRVALNMPGLGGSSGAAIDLARGPAAGTSAAQKAAEADMTALWRTSRAAYDALSEMVYRRLPAEEARAKLSPAAWSAAISIKCWRGWLEGVDEFAADAAFEAYRRGVRARGGTVDLPDGVPGDPVAMCEHVRHYCGADAAVVGTDGRSLVTLGLSADDYVAALEESLAAWRAGNVGNGRRLAAHILAVARRLVESPPAG